MERQVDDTEAVRDSGQCQGWRKQERLGPFGGCWGLGTGVSQETIGICMELMQCHLIFLHSCVGKGFYMLASQGHLLL